MRSLLLCFLALLTLPALHAQEPDVIAGDLLVMMRPDADVHRLVEDLRTLDGTATGIRLIREVSKPMRTWKLQFDDGAVPQAVMLRAVRNHPAVQLAQNNHRVKQRDIPNDGQYGDQWHHQNIDSEAAWAIGTGGLTADGDTIVVCIIENCDLPHEDLWANAWFNHQEIPDNDVDDDNNGYVDDFRGWNPNSETDEVYSGSHGTQVAGMVGAVGNNDLGVAGASWAVKMMIVFNSGADDEGVVASHTYPLTMRRLYNETNGERGAFVVATNASWGVNGGQPEDAPLWCAMYDSLGAQGVLNAGATTNSDTNVDEEGDLPTSCPSDFMISVTATNADDVRTFAGYGLTTIDVGAPGDDVFTTKINNNYGTASGTSFASPLTAGVIGLLYSAPCASMMSLVKADPEAGALFIRQKLFEGVDQNEDLQGFTVTGGRINAGNSMQLIMAGCGPCPAPYAITAMASDMTTTQVSWNAVNGSAFDLRYRQAGGPQWIDIEGIAEPLYSLQNIVPCTPYELQIRVHCTEGTSDYSNLYTWTSDGCCTSPSGLARGFGGDDLINVFWTPVLAATAYDVRYAPTTSTDYITVENITNAFLELTPLVPCARYNVQVRSRCNGTLTEWSAPLVVATTGCGACTDLPYCAAVGGNTNGEWIDRVSIGGIDHQSGDDDGYGDHTTVTTELYVSADYPLVLEPGFSNFQFTEWFAVWIDLDQSGDFDTAGEQVYVPVQGANDPVETTVTIPADATLGPTRMRVMMRYGQAPPGPCAGFDFGEVEDYCVTLIANPNPGIAENSTDVERIYPQPADERVYFAFPEVLHGTWLAVQVFDGTGRAVMQQTLQGTTPSLAVADLASGVYTYQLLADGSSVGQGRFVVSHLR